MGIITAFITEKYLLDYDTCLIERSRRTSNPAGRWGRISNTAGRFFCVTWFELFSQLATPGRSYARKIRNHSCGGLVEWKNERTREYLRSERPSQIRPMLYCGTRAQTSANIKVTYSGTTWATLRPQFKTFHNKSTKNWIIAHHFISHSLFLSTTDYVTCQLYFMSTANTDAFRLMWFADWFEYSRHLNTWLWRI